MNVNTTTVQRSFAPCWPQHWSAQWALLWPRMAELRSLRSVLQWANAARFREPNRVGMAPAPAMSSQTLNPGRQNPNIHEDC